MAATRALLALDSTFGFLFLAGILSTALWGVACAQLRLYYEKYSKTERWWLKTYIFLIWILDTIHQVLLVQSLYIFFVKEFGNILYLNHPQGTLIDSAVFAALSDAMVQSVFIMRVWHLSNRNYVLTGALVTVVLGLLAASLTYFGQTRRFTGATQFFTITDTVRAMNALVVVADTAIAFVLIFLLRRIRSGVRKSDSVIKRLVTYTIGTSLVTSVWGIVGLVGSEILPDSFLYLFIDLIMPKLYLNCLLASLNSRSKLREYLAGDSGLGCVSIDLSGAPSGPSGGSAMVDIPGNDALSSGRIEIKIDKDTNHGYERQQSYDTATADLSANESAISVSRYN